MGNLIKLNQLFDLSSLPKEGEHCVYSLFDSAGNCIYVGQSGNLEGRIYSHFRDGKDFVKFNFDVCDESEALELEARTIVNLNPKMNKILPTNNSYISTVVLKNAVIKFINDNEDNLEIVFVGDKFSKAKTKKYVTVDYYDRLIGCLSSFFTTGEEEA